MWLIFTHFYDEHFPPDCLNSCRRKSIPCSRSFITIGPTLPSPPSQHLIITKRLVLAKYTESVVLQSILCCVRFTFYRSQHCCCRLLFEDSIYKVFDVERKCGEKTTWEGKLKFSCVHEGHSSRLKSGQKRCKNRASPRSRLLLLYSKARL